MTRLKVKLLSDGRPNYQIAGMVGIDPALLSKYSLGKLPFSQKHLIKLCRFFEVDPEDLVGTYVFEVD